METRNAAALGIGMGILGGIVGAFVGNPMMGFKFGIMAGSMLFRPKMDDRAQVMKPSDIQIPTCELGRVIPVFYGAFGPVSGNVVYFGNKRKIAHVVEPETAGKGGSPPSRATIYYTWSVDFCMVLGWGPGTVLRCYAGGKEISLSKFRIYDGTQTTYDPIFANRERKPVYKGLILVCAEQYDLGESGQFPLFQFDVARKTAVPARGTAYWAGSSLAAAGGIDVAGDLCYLGGGSSTTAPLVSVYDPWIFRDDTVPATIPLAASAVAVSPSRLFLLEWTASPLKVYCYTRTTVAYTSTIDLTGTASTIYAIRCSEACLFVCYLSTGGSVTVRRYNLSDLSLRDTNTVSGITSGRVITDMAVTPEKYYFADSANNRIWDTPRSTLSATGRTIASGTAYGVTVDPAGNVWVATGGANVYVYTPAWSLSATITGSSITAARRVRLLENRHRMVVLNKSGDAGSIAVLSAGQLTQDVDQGGGTAAPDFAFERLWTVASTTTDITRLAASQNYVALVEKPSDDIYVYTATGDHINTIAGTFRDVAANDLGVYAAPASGTFVSFYAGGAGSANTRNVSTDVGGDINANGIYMVATGNESPGGTRRLYVLHKDNSYGIHYIAEYSLPANGQVSGATYVRRFRIVNGFLITAEATPTALAASPDGYGLLMTWQGGMWHYDPAGAYWMHVKGIGNNLRDACWIEGSARFITCKLTKIIANGGTGVPTKEFVDSGRFTQLNEVVYAAGRIYAADKVGTTGQSRVLSYVTENHPLSTVRELLPGEISYDMLTNTGYGAGLSSSDIDRSGEALVNSYCARNDLSLAPAYDTQTTAADFLEELCAHHNGFVRIAAGKIGHGQFYFDPTDTDCAFAERTARSDDFDDGSIGSQWIAGPNPSDQVESGGMLTLSPEASETAYIEQALRTAGAFDLQVDFSSYSVSSGGASAFGKALIQFAVDADNYCFAGREKSSTLNRYVFTAALNGTPSTTTVSTTAASGKLRLVRKGQTVSGYYHDGANWVLIAAYGGFSARPGAVRLFASSDAGVTTSVAFDNYRHFEATDALYAEHFVTEVRGEAVSSSLTLHPVVVSAGGSRDRPNQVLVEHSRRYVAAMPDTVAKASDPVDIAANGLVSMTIRLPGIRRPAPARFLANLMLMRAIAQQDTVQFEVGPQNELSAGDLCWITYPDAGLDHVPLRIVSEELTAAGTRKITALREEDIYDPDVFADETAVVPLPLRPLYPGSVEYVTTVLLAPEYCGPLDYQLDFFFTAPKNDAWAGAALYQSYSETGDYVLVKTTGSSAIQGVVAAVGGTTTKYIDVTLHRDDDLASISSIASMFQNLLYVNAHYIQFTTATLLSGTTWRLTGLVYDPNTSPVTNSYGSTAAGHEVVFYARRPLTLSVPDPDLNVELWFKVASINTEGNIQSLSDVDAFSVTVASRNTIPAIGDYVEGSPAALVGDAVHYEPSDNKYYRANPFTRPNVVGVKDGFGKIVVSGPAARVPGLSAGGDYYLKCPAVSEYDLYTGSSMAVYATLDATTTMHAQGFQVSASGRVVVAAKLWITANYVCWRKYTLSIEIRPDNGSGNPHATTVLARSEEVYDADVQQNSVTGSKAVVFRFFEYAELSSGTQYHLVLRFTGQRVPMTSSLPAMNFRVWGGSLFNGGGQWKTYTAGTWSADASNDMAMALYLADVSSTSSTNITTTHPFSTADYAPVMAMLPVLMVGRASSASELFVTVDRRWPDVLFQNTVDVFSGESKHAIGLVPTLSVERLIVLFHFWSSSQGDSTVATVYLDDVAGSDITENADAAPYQRMFRSLVFTKQTIGLSALKTLSINLDGFSATPKCGCVTVVGIHDSAVGGGGSVAETKSLIPLGGAEGDVLVKASDTGYDVQWATPDTTPADGSITQAKLASASAGNVLSCASDAEAQTNSTTYVKLKEIYVAKGGSYRVKFDLRRGVSGTAYGRVYRNGSPVGTEQTAGGTYETKSEDLGGWSAGDLCQVYAKHSTGAYNTYVANFRLYESAPLVSAAVL